MCLGIFKNLVEGIETSQNQDWMVEMSLQGEESIGFGLTRREGVSPYSKSNTETLVGAHGGPPSAHMTRREGA